MSLEKLDVERELEKIWSMEDSGADLSVLGMAALPNALERLRRIRELLEQHVTKQTMLPPPELWDIQRLAAGEEID